MQKIVKYFFIISLLVIEGNLIRGECLWDLNKDLPDNNPLYMTLDSEATFILPTSAGMHLSENESMTLECPGEFNTILGTGEQQINVTCKGENQLMYKNYSYYLTNFYCTKSLNPDINFTGEPCGTGNLFQLGYNTHKGFFNLIDVCYNRNSETVLYSKHFIYGEALAAKQITNSSRPSFQRIGLTYETITPNKYKKAEQLKRFTQLLGANRSNILINSTSFLARGHIAPDADFIFRTWSKATYFYINVAPQWQIKNAGNWLKVEYLARRIASNYQERIQAISGIHDVLKLPNEQGIFVDIYLLDNQLLRAPKWFWKVLYSNQTQKAIAFVTSNNPFATSFNSNELLCPNICNQVLLDSPSFANYTKGYTYCCDANTLFAAVGYSSSFVIKGNITGYDFIKISESSQGITLHWNLD